jgi:hypothetical protein
MDYSYRVAQLVEASIATYERALWSDRDSSRRLWVAVAELLHFESLR